MSKTLTLLLLLLWHFGFGQIGNLKGDWVSQNGDIISIGDEDYLNNTLSNQSEKLRYLKLIYVANTIAFQSISISKTQKNTKIINEFNFQVLKHSEEELILKPTSNWSQSFLNSKDTITFNKRDFKSENYFNFEKLFFKITSTPSFSLSPEIKLSITSDKEITASCIYYDSGIKIDSTISGNFIGTLNDTIYSQFINLMLKAKVDSIELYPTPFQLCCDGSVKTLKTYFNNGRWNYFKTMFEPDLFEELIKFLSNLPKSVKLERVEGNLSFDELN
jgi:hypothetical protein